MVIDPAVAAQLDEWREDLKALYTQLREWLSAMELHPRVTEHAIQLNEERSGPYEVEELIVTHLDRHLKIRPVARWVVGADGRVDLLGTEGPFILVNLKDRGGWYYLADRSTFDLRSLDGDLFRRLASACLQ